MKRLFAGLIIVFFLFVSASADHRAVIARKNAEDYSDIVLWINWNNADCSPPITAYTVDNGNTEYTAFGTNAFSGFNGEAEINETQPQNGLTCGFDQVDAGANGGDNATLPVASATTFASQGRAGMTVFIPTGTWGDDVFIMYLDANPSTEYVRVKFDDSDEVRVYWDDTTSNKTIITTNSPISENTQHFIEVAWDSTQAGGSDYLEIWVDGVSKKSSSTLTMTEGDIVPASAHFGNQSGNSGDVYQGVIVWSTDITRDLFDLVITDTTTDYPG